MTRTRYLLLLLAVLVGAAARGQDFNPDSPEEPSSRYRLSVKASPAEAATVKGGGMYVVNKRVTVSATATDAKWKFRNWTDSNSEVVSDKASFTYTTTNANVTLTANYDEVKTSVLTIAYDPQGIADGKVTTYAVGTAVTVSAPSYSSYTFVNWTSKTGEVVSSNSSFTYTVTLADETLTAHYRYTPGSPSEPSETKPKHKVYLVANPAAANSFSQTSGFAVSEGSSYSVTAYDNSGYVLKNWTIDGEVVGTANTYQGVMGKTDITLVANYTYSPSGPSEPSSDATSRHTLYCSTVSVNKGETVLMPVYLENTGNVKSLTFTLSLPEGFTASTSGIQTTSRTSGYEVSATLSGTSLTVALSGGSQISDHNGVIVHIPLTASDETAEGKYGVSFSDMTATALDGSSVSLTCRKGWIAVIDPVEDGLQAQFSIDRYMNRAQFTNMSSENAVSFLWEFGDGTTSTERDPMHIYTSEGTYTVRLTARGSVKSSVVEQGVVINPSSTWKSGGDYTLDESRTSVRNFTSLHETVDLLSRCTPEGEIIITVAEGKNFVMDATHADSLSLLTTLKERLVSSGFALTFKGTDAESNVLTFNANSTSADLQATMAFIATLKTDNAKVSLNGALIEISEIGKYESQAMCSGNSTEPVPFTAISSSDKVSVTWTASVSAGCQITGFETSGSGDLPSMTLTNGASSADKIAYQVNVTLGGVLMYTYIYNLYVNPLLAGKTLTLSSPADAAEINYGSYQLRWNAPSAPVNGYRLTLHRTVNEVSTDEVYNTTNTYYNISAVPGASYTWTVTAIGECDELTSDTRTFTVRKQADLTVVSVTAPEEAKAGNSITVTAVVRNIGGADTQGSSWSDALYYGTEPNNLAAATLVSRQSHSGTLAAGGEYEVTWNVTCPEASLGTVYYYVVTDCNSNEAETDENNNSACSSALGIISKYVAEADFEALKNLYNATNGGAWKKGWRISNNAITAAAWPGVTFDEEGNVTAISLPDNNIAGTLPTEGSALPHLTSLNLSRNPLKGDLAAFCSQFAALTTLNMSYCRFTGLTAALPSTINSLDLSYQCNDLALSTVTLQSWTMGDITSDIQLGTIIGYNHASQSFDLHPRLQLRTASGNSYVGYMEYSDGGYRYRLSGDYKYAQNTEFIVQSTEGSGQYTRMRATLSWTTGDANVDAAVDVLDAQHTLNYILGRSSGSFNFVAADTYASGSINVQDVVATINLFIDEEESTAAKSYHRLQQSIDGAVAANVLDIRDGYLWIDAVDNVAALDVTISGAKAEELKLMMSSLRYQMVTHNTPSGVRVVIMSPAGYTLSGSVRLLRLPEGSVVTRAMGADEEAKAVSVVPASATTGIGSISTSDPEGRTYDLNGRMVEGAMPHGVYIRNGKKTLKH